jgi:hypothetical protein
MTGRPFFPRPCSVTIEQADWLTDCIRRRGLARARVLGRRIGLDHNQVLYFYLENKDFIQRKDVAA